MVLAAVISGSGHLRGAPISNFVPATTSKLPSKVLIRNPLGVSESRVSTVLRNKAMDTVVTPAKEFAKNSTRLVKRCTKPDRKGTRPHALDALRRRILAFAVRAKFGKGRPCHNVVTVQKDYSHDTL